MPENENTQAVLEACLNFCDALIAHGSQVPHAYYNLLTFSGNQYAVDHALKGQTQLLENHRDALEQALQV